VNRIARFLAVNRVPVLAVIAVVTAVAAWSLRDLRINPDVVSYFPDGDPAVRLFKETGKNYGGTSMAVVALEAPDVFTAPVIRDIAKLTGTFRSLEGVSSVTSLTNVIDIRGGEEGIVIGRLIDPHAIPDDPAQLARLRDYALSRDMIRGRLVSEDGRMSLIVCRLADEADEVAVAGRIHAAVDSSGITDKTWLAGFPFQMYHITEIILRDLKTLVPVAGLVVVICLLIGFRSPAGVALPLLTALISSVWTLGLMAALGIPLTVISDVLPVILIAVGSAYGIHVVNKYRETHGAGPKERLETTMHVVGVSVLLAGLTTVIGFLSFIFGSYLTLIRDFGVFASIGIACALLISLTLVPVLLTFTKRTDRARAEVPHRVFTVLAETVCRHRGAVAAAGVVVAAGCGVGMLRLERNAAILDYFKAGTAIRAAENVLSEGFGGSIPISIVVNGDMQDPAVLGEMEKMTAFLDSQPAVHNAQSVADLIGEMNGVMGEGRRVPDSREKVVNLWFMLEGEEALGQMVSPDYREGLISATCENLKTRGVHALVRAIDDYIARADSPVCTFRQTGLHLVYRNLDDSIIRTLYQSLALSLGLVFVCLLVMLRSFRAAILGCIPIVFTLLVVFGTMGWTGLPLDVVTVLIGSVSIGIGIDYAIHFANRFRAETARGMTPRMAVRETIETTGRAIVINAATVACGFLVLVFADLVPLQQFGVLVALTMVSSGLGALTLLPAAILLFAGPGARSGGGKRRRPGYHIKKERFV